MALLSKKAYYNQFKNKKGKIKKEKVKKALEQAWKNRDFEIEMYWKRATYFWAFIAVTFAGYFGFISSTDFKKNLPQGELIISCLGLIFSEAWYLANIGSKKWQVNWERHIDMLEKYVTGNIYKTVLNKEGYSVSELNKQVSHFMIWIWGILILKFIYTQVQGFSFELEPDYLSIIVTVVTINFVILIKTKSTNKVDKIPDDGRILFSSRKVRYFKLN